MSFNGAERLRAGAPVPEIPRLPIQRPDKSPALADFLTATMGRCAHCGCLVLVNDGRAIAVKCTECGAPL